VCEYDATQIEAVPDHIEKVCVGCGRSSSEITEWSTATKDRKREIVKAAKIRRKI
jgi:predicted Fe-S protein YdhL (DUF1289 family)